MTKKNATKKPKMKKMFAVVQTVFDREDLEDSEVKICGVYAIKKIADQKCDEAKQNFLKGVGAESLERAEEMLEDDYDRMYGWNVIPVNVEI